MDHLNSLALARVALGAGFLASPEKALTYGFLDASSPQSAYLARMFGAREVALGAVTLLAKPEAKTALTWTGIAVDVSDAAAGALVMRARGVSNLGGALLTGGAVAAVVTGVLALKQRRALS